MSENQAENESESLPTFRPFTREELAVIENRISEKKLAAKKKAERRARNIAVSATKKYYIRQMTVQGRGTGTAAVAAARPAGRCRDSAKMHSMRLNRTQQSLKSCGQFVFS